MRFPLLTAVLLTCLSTHVFAADTPTTGVFTLSFQTPYPASNYGELSKRYNWSSKPEYDPAYVLAQEEYEVNVPANYDGTTTYGLIVFTNSGKGGLARMYSKLLAERRLIWIGANNVPNERGASIRWGIAMDAAWNMPKRYRIDPRRIYAVGNSGGGRCSSMIAPTWPELFSGGIYLVGCNEPILPKDPTLAAKARAGRYALVTGTKDFNRKDTQDVLKLYQTARFQHVDYFEQPGLGHANPNEEWFGKALTFVDEPLVAEANALVTQAKPQETKKPYDAAVAYLRILHEYPMAETAVATATTRLAELTPVVEQALATEMDKLGSGSKDRWRAMAKRTLGFAAHERAQAAVDAFGQKELKALGTTPTPAKLLRFAQEWNGCPCATAALDVYEQQAGKALAPLLAQDAAKRPKVLAKFLKDWQDCPSRVTGAEQLEADLAAELSAINTLTKGKAQKLTEFARTWTGTRAGTQAAADLANDKAR